MCLVALISLMVKTVKLIPLNFYLLLFSRKMYLSVVPGQMCPGTIRISNEMPVDLYNGTWKHAAFILLNKIIQGSGSHVSASRGQRPTGPESNQV